MTNSFVEYLTRFYTGGAAHQGVFDEYNLDNRQYDVVLHVNTRVEQDVLRLFERPCPPSVILTGNAGDGKTRLARTVVEDLSANLLTQWGEPHEPYELELDGYILRVLKDLSDFDRSLAQEMLCHISAKKKDSDTKPIVYLIAANEGKLRDSLPDDDYLRDTVQNQLTEGPDHSHQQLVLFNLNLERTSHYVTPLLQSVTSPALWEECKNCRAHGQCPIYFNRVRLSERHIQERMTNLYQVIEQSGFHITMRDMLIHLSHTLVGTNNCDTVLEKLSRHVSEPWRHVYYQNCWAQEQPDEHRRVLNVVSHLDKLQIGEKSQFDIDTFILHGGQSAAEQALHEKLFAKDLDLGGDLFDRQRSSYLAGHGVESEARQHPVLGWLPHCRRKLFFEWVDPQAHQLITLKTVADFRRYVETENYWDLADQALPMILCGLNRALTGFYLDEETARRELYVTSQYQGSSAVVVPIIKTAISSRDIELQQFPKHNPDRLRLTFRQTGDMGLEINQLMYEYLIRLAEGGTQNILAEECELRLRNFKDQLLANVSLFQGRADARRMEFFAEVGGERQLFRVTVQNGKVRVQS